jgi:SanA protein
MLILRISGLLLLTLILVFFIPRLITLLYSFPRTYLPAAVPSKRVAIVFGAGLTRDGSPSPVLRERVATAAGLYFSGKVEKLLMSGDNRFIYYNEPGAMREYALALGVPEDAVVLDYAGRRTYDTCYRAKAIFQLDQAILVTQQFHLPRALFTCNKLGLPSVGVPADQVEYFSRSRLFWNLREIPATAMALWEIFFAKPLPVLGDPEPIFPKETP